MLTENLSDCLRRTILFESMPDEVVEGILPNAQAVTYKAGDTIFRENEPAKALFCIDSGSVKLSIIGRNGNETVVEIIYPGTSIAEALLFREATYPVSAEALTDCRLVVISKPVIEKELRSRPDAMATVIAATFSHMHRLLRQVEDLKATSGLERVAGYILAMDDMDPSTNIIRIPFTKQTLASMLGIEPETLSRSFKRLSEYGVQVDGPRIHVLDRRALKDFLRVD